MSREKRIQEIINTKRMSKHPGEEGQFSRGLYQLIKDNFKPHFEVIQIGTYEGVTAALFALTCQSVITVDPFGEGYNFGQESQDDLIRAEKMAISRLAAYPNVNMVKKTSKDFFESFNGQVDAIYTDGDHSKQGVRYDLENGKIKLKQGGYMSGHDWGDTVVQSTIIEIIGKPDKTYDDGSWIKQIV